MFCADNNTLFIDEHYCCISALEMKTLQWSLKPYTIQKHKIIKGLPPSWRQAGDARMHAHTIETERLILREFRDGDTQSLLEMLSAPSIMRWLFGTAPMVADEARHFINKNFIFGKQAYGLGVLCAKEAEFFVGFAGLLPCRYLHEGDFELGFALQEDSWGKGYATEIAVAQIPYGFKNFDVRRLLGLAHPQNTASMHALEKIGMKLLKTINVDQRGPRRIYTIKRNT
jgi:ribosomal-protein-alanine N-acetyltransferase